MIGRRTFWNCEAACLLLPWRPCPPFTASHPANGAANSPGKVNGVAVDAALAAASAGAPRSPRSAAAPGSPQPGGR